MAGRSFSDFSALKSLKKELEKQDDSKNPSKPAIEPRKKIVTHKSKEDSLGDQKARETGLQPGMRVALMDSSDRGVIKEVREDCVEIELDYGFVVPVGFGEFVVNDAEEDFGASIRNLIGGRSGSYENEFVDARTKAMREMESRSRDLGANAVVGIDIDYEVLGEANGMLMVSASNTARLNSDCPPLIIILLSLCRIQQVIRKGCPATLQSDLQRSNPINRQSI